MLRGGYIGGKGFRSSKQTRFAYLVVPSSLQHPLVSKVFSQAVYPWLSLAPKSFRASELPRSKAMSLQTTTRWCPDFVVHPWWFGESSWALNARWNVWLPPGMKRQLTSNIFSLLGGSTTNQRWRSEGPMKWWWPFESSLATPWLLAMNGGKFIDITLDVATDWFCLEASVSLPSSKLT